MRELHHEWGWTLIVLGEDEFRVRVGDMVSEVVTLEDLSRDYPFLASMLDDDQRDSKST